MTAVESLLNALDERTIARQVGIRHDEARMSYHLQSNTVATFDEFSWIIGDYYNYHYTTCVSNGGRLSASEAEGRAKEIIEQQYRKRNGDTVTAFNDCHDGTNGGLRAVCDMVSESLKADGVQRYIRAVFDHYVNPASWEEKVAIMRQFLDRCGAYLSSSINLNQPERYAQNYNELIQTYTRALQQNSSVFRRL